MHKHTHKQLVEVAHKWVLNNTSCGVAFKELKAYTSNGETPDVIGFGQWNHSILIEVKVSRSDFLADKKKKFRQDPAKGMGSQRFYCCPTGMIKKEELPSGWGLIYVSENLRATCVHKNYKGNVDERNNGFVKDEKAEYCLLYSALRRLELRGRIEEVYQPVEEVNKAAIVSEFAEKLVNSQESMPAEFAEIVDEHFWELT